MVVGVTMVNVVPGEERYVYRTLLELSGIREVYHVFGEYDFVVIIEVEASFQRTIGDPSLAFEKT